MTASSVLGRQVGHPEHYSPDVLEAIPRAAQRARLGIDGTPPFYGADLWTAWELSWLEPGGKPRVAVARLSVPSHSPAIVESKSLKLYLNSLYQTVFDEPDAVKQRIATDLSERLGAEIGVELLLPAHWHEPLSPPPGECLDDQPVDCQHYQPAPELLRQADGATEQWVQRCWHSHLLRSRCPVTEQPDWATVWIEWHGPELDSQALLQYLVSFRQHQDFHEQCVERIFLDLWQRFEPRQLLVGARFLRRGGIDINPVRSSEPVLAVADMRLFRQ